MKATPVQFPPARVIDDLQRPRNEIPRPELLHAVGEWAAGLQPARLVLTGLDGAGKTSLLARIVSDLVSGRRDSKLIPQGTYSWFVASLDHSPTPDGVLDAIYAWLLESGACVDERRVVGGHRQRATALQVLHALETFRDAGGRRLLIVIDALERVQDDGVRGGIIGRLESAAFEDFLQGLDHGVVSVITTLRFPHPHIRTSEFGTLVLPVDGFAPAQSIDLLAREGVEAPEPTRTALAEVCAHNPLRLKLAAAWIRRFEKGNPRAEFRLPPPEQSEKLVAGIEHPALRADVLHCAALAELADDFRQAFLRDDPAAISLLERCAALRLAISPSMIVSLFTGENAAQISGPQLAALSERQVRASLDQLAGLGWIDRAPGGRFRMRPALAEAVVQGAPEAAMRATHDRLHRALETVPGGRQPVGNERPTSPATLDLLEEIAWHSWQAGTPREAFNVYHWRMGGAQNLAMLLGDFERGERLCRMLSGGRSAASAPAAEGVGEAYQSQILADWATYLDAMARLEEAARCLQRAIAIDIQSGEWANPAMNHLSLADVRAQQGNLVAALASVKRAITIGTEVQNPELLRSAHALHGNLLSLRGEYDAADKEFSTALRLQSAVDEEQGAVPFLYGMRGVWHAEHLARIGQWERAADLAAQNCSVCGESGDLAAAIVARCNLLLAEAAARDQAPALSPGAHPLQALPGTVRSRLDAALATARAHGLRELHTRALLARIRSVYRMRPSPFETLQSETSAVEFAGMGGLAIALRARRWGYAALLHEAYYLVALGNLCEILATPASQSDSALLRNLTRGYVEGALWGGGEVTLPPASAAANSTQPAIPPFDSAREAALPLPASPTILPLRHPWARPEKLLADVEALLTRLGS